MTGIVGVVTIYKTDNAPPETELAFEPRLSFTQLSEKGANAPVSNYAGAFTPMGLWWKDKLKMAVCIAAAIFIYYEYRKAI